MNKSHLKSFIFLICSLIAIVICLGIAFLTQQQDLSINNESLAEYNENWEVSINGQPYGKYNLPLKLDLPPGTEVQITNTIPEKLAQNSTLFFRATQSFVKIFIDEELHYSFGYEPPPAFGKSPGSSWQIMRIPTNDFGKEITIQLTSNYAKFAGNLESVYIGTKASITFSIISENIFGFILCVLIFMVGIAMWLAYIFCHKILEDKRLLYLGGFAIFFATWALTETKILQIFIGNVQLISVIAFLSMALVPLGFSLFLSCFKDFQKDKILNIFYFVFAANFIIINLLQLFQIVDYFESIFITHLLMGAAIFYISLRSIILYRKNTQNKDSLVLCLSILTMCLFFAFDLVRFYGDGMFDFIFFSRIGFLLFVLILGSWTCKQTVQSYSQRIESGILRTLAYTDGLTKLKNRTAFEKHMDIFRSKDQYHKDIIIVVIDVNNLKLINDQLGHAFGDKALLTVSQLIEESFRILGDCYRVGGDEFCCICEDHTVAEIELALQSLTQNLEKQDPTPQIKCSAAMGFKLYSANTPLKIEAVFREADQAMYTHKLEMKAALAK